MDTAIVHLPNARSVRETARANFRPIVLMLASLTAVTLLVAGLEQIGVGDSSPLYLLSVVAVAVLAGTRPALAAAVIAFLLYDLLFVEPRFTLTVDDPREWLDLLLLLVIGLVVGRLAGRERDRAEVAVAREREARGLFRISFALAERPDTRSALPDVLRALVEETRSDRAWAWVGDTVVADTHASAGEPPRPAVHWVLRRRPGEQPAEWTRVHTPGSPRTRTEPDPPVAATRASRASSASIAYKVQLMAGDRALGALWVQRGRDAPPFSHGETRVLAAAADQVAGSLERDRLRSEATSVEITRRSDALKSALLDSVSHDLRTPLAAIRAAAGTLMDPAVDWPDDERRDIATSIDRDAAWLDRLVSNLLDMSRLDAGGLRPDLQVFALEDLVRDAVGRAGRSVGPERITVALPDDLPPVWTDDLFLGQVLANLLDNAAKYAGPTAPIRIVAVVVGDRVRLTVEDGGSGVAEADRERLFEKFYRAPRTEGSRRGTGIGLSVVRGLMETMGGAASVERSPLGGLAVHLDLPTAPPPPAAQTDEA